MSRAVALPDEAISIAGWARIILRSGALVTWLFVCIPLYLCWHPFTHRNPWSRRFLRGASRIMGARCRVIGAHCGPGSFLLANHVSWLDIPILAGLTGTTFVAQDGLAKMTWLRWLCSLHHTVFVARDRKATVAGQVEQVREAIRDTGALTIFPEGTTGDGVGLLPFKSSLLSAVTPVPPGISVQPVWIDYGPQSSKIAWVGEEPGSENYLKLAARGRPVDAQVHFLAPLSGDALIDRKSITLAARIAIEACLNESRRAAD